MNTSHSGGLSDVAVFDDSCIIVYIITVLSSVMEDSYVIVYIVTVLFSGHI